MYHLLPGEMYGKLEVLTRQQNRTRKNDYILHLRCHKCQNEDVYMSERYLLQSRRTTCCAKTPSKTARNQSRTPEYRAWAALNPKPEEWEDNYNQFLRDLGKKPKHYRLARKDPNKPHSKHNTHWVKKNVKNT